MGAIELVGGSEHLRGPHNFISLGAPKGHNPDLHTTFIILWNGEGYTTYDIEHQEGPYCP
jgi:hypothetical protein